MAVDGGGIWLTLTGFFRAVTAAIGSVSSVHAFLARLGIGKSELGYNPDFALAATACVLDLADIHGKLATYSRSDDLICTKAGAQKYKFEFAASGLISDFSCSQGVIYSVEKRLAHSVVTIELDKPYSKDERVTVSCACRMQDAFTADVESIFVDVRRRTGVKTVRARVIFPAGRSPKTVSYVTQGDGEKLPYENPETETRLDNGRTTVDWRIGLVKQGTGYILEWRW